MAAEPDDLEMLIRHELAIKQLYELFAEKYPERRDFWLRIAAVEQRHSDLLRSLRSKKALENWFLSDVRSKRLALKASLEYLAKQTERIRKVTISLLEALSISKDVEDALIEKQFLRIDDSVVEEVAPVMKSLVAETQEHRKLIAEALTAEKLRKS